MECLKSPVKIGMNSTFGQIELSSKNSFRGEYRTILVCWIIRI